MSAMQPHMKNPGALYVLKWKESHKTLVRKKEKQGAVK